MLKKIGAMAILVHLDFFLSLLQEHNILHVFHNKQFFVAPMSASITMMYVSDKMKIKMF